MLTRMKVSPFFWHLVGTISVIVWISSVILHTDFNLILKISYCLTFIVSQSLVAYLVYIILRDNRRQDKLIDTLYEVIINNVVTDLKAKCIQGIPWRFQND